MFYFWFSETAAKSKNKSRDLRRRRRSPCCPCTPPRVLTPTVEGKQTSVTGRWREVTRVHPRGEWASHAHAAAMLSSRADVTKGVSGRQGRNEAASQGRHFHTCGVMNDNPINSYIKNNSRTEFVSLFPSEGRWERSPWSVWACHWGWFMRGGVGHKLFSEHDAKTLAPFMCGAQKLPHVSVTSTKTHTRLSQRQQ